MPIRTIISMTIFSIMVVLVFRREIIRFISLFVSGLKEYTSCGCFITIVMLTGTLLVVSKCSESKTKSAYLNSRKSSGYRSKPSSYSFYTSKPYEALPDIVDSVYICGSGGSYAFHARKSCGALNRCESYIAKIPVEEARDMGRTPCQRCSKYVTFKEEEE